MDVFIRMVSSVNSLFGYEKSHTTDCEEST